MLMLKLTEYYKNLKIKNKLFLILFILILCVSLLGLFALQISYNIYDEHLINQSSVILNLYSTNIESELRKIEQMTFGILSDQKVQAYLKIIKDKDKDETFERITAINDLMQKLMAEAQSEIYISSIGVVDNEGNEYGVGRYTIMMGAKERNRIIAKAKEKKGGISWLESSNEDNHVIAVREIRAKENMETLAVLFIRINLTNLINNHLSMESKYKPNLLILSEEGKLIYSSNRELNFDIDKFIKNRVHSRYIENINDKKFLIYYGTSEYTDWTYIHILPYDNIFKEIIAMRTIMVIAYILVFIGIAFVGIRFANSITNPIISLSNKMKRVEQGNFDVALIDTDLTNNGGDEIRQLEYDFAIMVNKINTLIKENYVKQLLIKETELKMLQAQINPHFLYNTLAIINGLARMNGQHKISAVVKSLGNLFRAIMNKETVITIGEELSLLNDYITIQKIRYGDRLDFDMNVEEGLEEYPILKLTLQPIVENSIKYGLENLMGVCKIRLEAKKYPEYIRITVSDNGPGMSKDMLEKLRSNEIESKGLGIGLKNIDERIKLIFGEQFGLSFESVLGEGTTVHIKLPNRIK